MAFRSFSGFELRGGTFKFGDTLQDFDMYEGGNLETLLIQALMLQGMYFAL